MFSKIKKCAQKIMPKRCSFDTSLDCLTIITVTDLEMDFVEFIARTCQGGTISGIFLNTASESPLSTMSALAGKQGSSTPVISH